MKKKTSIILKKILETGIHYGHKTKEWNPKMAPYILCQQKGFHILNLAKSIKLIDLAGRILKKKALENKNILVVGTSKAATNIVEKFAKTFNFFYINHKWFGGMLTNWSTLKAGKEKLKALETEYINGKFKNLSKKDYTKQYKIFEYLNKNFAGIKEMEHLPDFVIFASQTKEKIGIDECIKLGIPFISIVDSNGNPESIPYPIPANDDTESSILLVFKLLAQKLY